MKKIKNLTIYTISAFLLMAFVAPVDYIPVLIPQEDITIAQNNWIASVDGITFSNNNEDIIVGGDNNNLVKLDITNIKDKTTITLNNDSQPVYSVAISPDGLYALAGSTTGLDLRKVATPNEEVVLNDQKDINALAFSHNGKYVATGSLDGSIVIRNWKDKRILQKLTAGSNEIVSLAVTSDAKVISVSFDGKAYLISSEGSRLLEENVTATAISYDDNQVIFGRFDGRLEILNLATGKKKFLAGHKKFINSVAISKDGQYAITGSDDTHAILWDINRGKAIKKYIHHTKPIVSVAFAPNGEYVVTGGNDGHIMLWKTDYLIKGWIDIEGFNRDKRKIVYNSDYIIRGKISQPYITIFDGTIINKKTQEKFNLNIRKVEEQQTTGSRNKVNARDKAVEVVPLPKNKTKKNDFSKSVELEIGENTFTIKLNTNIGILKQEVNLIYHPGEVKAVIVGIDDYNYMNKLKYCVPDALSMKGYTISNEGLRAKVENIKLIRNHEGTKANILQELKQVSNEVNTNDLLVFSFAGHGGEHFLYPYDNDKLFHNEIIQIMESSKAKNKIIILDACHSGSARQSITSYSNSNIAILMSCAADEAATEERESQQGVFTKYLLEGLQKEKAIVDSNNDNILTLNEVFEYARIETEETETHLRNQHPKVYFSNSDIKNYPFGYIQE